MHQSCSLSVHPALDARSITYDASGWNERLRPTVSSAKAPPREL